jgi:hypothetical protein
MEYYYSKSLIIILLNVHLYGYTNGKVVGGFVLPHGGVALDPRNFNTKNQTERNEAKTLHEACLKVGRDVRNINPDVIFLSTPHGLSDYRNFLLYSNDVGSGMFCILEINSSRYFADLSNLFISFECIYQCLSITMRKYISSLSEFMH